MSNDILAAGFVAGVGIESDTAGGRAASIFGDVSVGDSTWVSATAAATQTGGDLNLDTVFVDLGVDHSFDPVGVDISASYWGDNEILDSFDLRAAVYARGYTGYFSANFERRDFDFTFRALLDPRQVRVSEFQSDGMGLSARFNISEKTNLFAGGMSYRYSRDIRIQPQIDLLIDFSNSRLSLMNSLLDYRAYAGVEWRFGLSAVDIRVEQWRSAIDGDVVNSIGLGLLTPVSDRGDMEYRFIVDESEAYGRTVSFGLYYYFFGG